jgi:hypothetical protein
MDMQKQRTYLPIRRVDALSIELEKMRTGETLETPREEPWLCGSWFQKGHDEKNYFVEALRNAKRIEIHVLPFALSHWLVTITCHCVREKKKWKHQVCCHLDRQTGDLISVSGGG